MKPRDPERVGPVGEGWKVTKARTKGTSALSSVVLTYWHL